MRPHQAPVTIVMCTYNGARWLPAQLASFAAQDHQNWSLVVSDDGSSDDTCDILRAFAKEHPVTLYETPRRSEAGLAPLQRAARHYMTTLTRPDLPVGPESFVALSDQDDIWRPDKLSHGIGVLQCAGHPLALYGGQSRHIAEDGTVLAHSRPPRRKAGFRNALVQNVVSGHSAILTPQAMARLRQAERPDGVWYHDWWVYLLLSGCGAQVLVDDHIGLDYRQHATNVMGAGQGRKARARRLRQIFNGEYGQWLHANLAALSRNRDLLTPAAQEALARLQPRPTSPAALWRSGAYRHKALETFCLFIAAGLKKL